MRWIRYSRDLTPAPTPTVTVIVICLPTKHLRIGKNSLKRVHALQTELEFVSFSFLELFGGETGLPREKPLGPRERTNNKLNPQYGVKTGIWTQFQNKAKCETYFCYKLVDLPQKLAWFSK